MIIDQIVKFKKAGGEVYYFEGNHDVHIDVFWTKKFDIPVIENMKYFDIDGLTVRMEHGDFINPNDRAFLRYRELIHRPWAEFFGHNLPSHFWKWLGENQSHKSRKKTSRYAVENSEKIVKLVRSHAETAYKEKSFDLIVTGHMHIFDDYQFEVSGQKIRSINLGTWLERPRALKITDKKIEVVNLDDFVENSVV